MKYNLPGLDGKCIGWIVNYSNKNYWKVADFMSKEDLIHEGFDCLLLAYRKYPDRVSDPKRFMNTVRLIFTNHIPYLQNRNIRMPEGQLMRIADMCGSEKELAFTEMLLGPDEDQELQEVIIGAPERIRPILKAFVDENSPLHEVLQNGRRYHRDGTRQTFNEKLCAFLGIDPNKYDVCEEIYEYLGA